MRRWPSILSVNVSGQALREQRSAHCPTTQITTWTGSSLALTAASGRPPLNTQDRRLIVEGMADGSVNYHGRTISMTIRPMQRFMSVRRIRVRGEGYHRKQPSDTGWPSSRGGSEGSWKCIINQFEPVSHPVGTQTSSAPIPFAPDTVRNRVLDRISSGTLFPLKCTSFDQKQ